MAPQSPQSPDSEVDDRKTVGEAHDARADARRIAAPIKHLIERAKNER